MSHKEQSVFSRQLLLLSLHEHRSGLMPLHALSCAIHRTGQDLHLFHMIVSAFVLPYMHQCDIPALSLHDCSQNKTRLASAHLDTHDCR